MEQKLMKKQIMNKKLIFFGFLLALITGLGFPQTVSAQTSAKVIKMEVKSERLTEALKRLEKLSGYKILFSYDDLSQFTVANKHIKTKDIRAALNTLLAGKPVAYHIEGTYVNVFLDENAYRTAQRQQRSQTQGSQQAQQSSNIELSGTITDPSGEPLVGATVLIEGTNQGYSTGLDGKFILYVPRGRQTTLRFSYVGMGTVNRVFSGRRDETGLKVILEENNELKEVVVNGMFERRKDTYTGSTVTFSKDQLESVGNQNVIKSLANLDPSFQIVENLDAGSNPNSMPNETFKNELRQVIGMADAHTVYVVNKYSTFIYMNGMMPNVEQAIAKLPATLKSSDEGRKMVNYYYSMRTLKVGDKVPDFTMPTPDGKQVNLYSYLKKNKCTVLDFWASWCHWCRAENPNLKKTYEAFKDKGCGFLSFSFDDKRERWTKAIEEDKNPWTQVSDLKGCEGANCSDVYKQFDINGIPAILLVDSQGKVIQLRMRGDQIYNSVNDYLSQK